ncbi:unnamed protein product [Rhodiola kirilowii]
MSFISEAASAIKSRFGFHDPHSEPSMQSVKSTPKLMKTSSSKDNLILQSSAANSAFRSTGERDESEISTSLSFELSEDPSFWKDHNVQVIIRVRPLNNMEISLQGYNKCVKQESSQTITWTGHPESRFTFDAVADETVSQEKLFKVAGVPMVENCVGGYNSCMFAYGQTGSGKTHTMLGDIEGGTRRHSVNCGMTPRVFEYMFQRIQKEREAQRDEKLKFTCKCSFLEIYNEQILDLLDPSSNNLQIREDHKKGVYVENLKEIEVSSARDVMQQLLQGAVNRKVAATNMNLASSRSHSVFTCIIESKWESQGVNHHRFARLNLVDLAGSERQKSSGAEGERLKEATNINKSLSTLGLVIMNLVSISNGKSLHVPYRDSKLTFLLQDSLGGNSKTTIIANISPSICCSAETLSTLKFAQRAKFIKNNAIVNEDASGDVIALRLQIQQLKKEVARLRSVGNVGHQNLESETGSVYVPGSPGSLKWDGLQGSFSPLTSDKKMSSKKEYEAAVVAALRREKDKEMSLQAMAVENQAALHLAKQREDEIRALKMRLRFREAGIKRLEGVASGKISAESHLLKEREEYLKEIEVLRAQVDRNQEVTRFAMENLRLKEELRRLKSFAEEGEREMMQDQITLLKNKLLEALDWKLMHESEASLKEPGSPWQTSSNEENEFLRMQAFQNQSEIDALRKKLSNFVEEKDQLERKVKELENKLASTTSREENQRFQDVTLSPTKKASIVDLGDQMELKTMVDAIAAASQREAEAHETAIFLSRENDELRMKLKTLVEDNNKLIELYERAAAEIKIQKDDAAFVTDQINEDASNLSISLTAEKKTEMTQAVEKLEHQLADLHEENERLMGLYEQAMRERDEYKRMQLAVQYTDSQIMGVDSKEMDDVESFERDERMTSAESESPRVSDVFKSEEDNREQLVESSGMFDSDVLVPEVNDADEQMSLEMAGLSKTNLQAEAESVVATTESASAIPEKISESLRLARRNLDTAEEKLYSSTKSLTVLHALEKAYMDIDGLSRDLEESEGELRAKEQELKQLESLSSETQEKRAIADQKLKALKHSLSNFHSSIAYYDQREERAKGRVKSALYHLNQKEEELARLQAFKVESKVELSRLQQSETKLETSLACLKPKLDAENENVLMPIENIEEAENIPTQKKWIVGKATELLKSEEKVVSLRKEIDTLKGKITKMDKSRQVVQLEAQRASKTFEEMDAAFNQVVLEKQMLVEMIKDGKREFESMIIEYQQLVFQTMCKEIELQVVEEDMSSEYQRIQELQFCRVVIAEKMNQVLESRQIKPHSFYLSDKLDEELQIVQMSISEAKSFLDVGSA